jgi:uncharacterized membrane protein YtjA (UPF0391 family)
MRFPPHDACEKPGFNVTSEYLKVMQSDHKNMGSITLIWLGMAICTAIIGFGFGNSPVAEIARVLFAAFTALLVITLALRFGSWVSDRQFKDRAR